MTEGGVNYTHASVEPSTTLVLPFGRSRTGAANPKWRSQIRSDSNAATVFDGYESAGSGTPCEGKISYEFWNAATGKWRESTYKHSGYFSGLNMPSVNTSHYTPSPASIEANAIAIRNLHRQIDRMNHQFMGGVFVAELHQAVKMVLSPAKKLRSKFSDYLTALAKRRRGVAKEKLGKVLAETYLEYTFGWQPLLGDVKDAVKVFKRFSANDPERSRFRTKGETQIQLSQSTAYKSVGVMVPFMYNQTVVTSGKVIVVYYGLFRGGVLDPNRAASSAEKLSSLCGFDLASFVPTVWELIPWSFVVDYFTNIGDMIQAYSNVASQCKWLVKVTIITTQRDVRSVPDNVANKAWLRDSGVIAPSYRLITSEGLTTRSKSSYKSVSRAPTTVPFPVFAFEVPKLDSMKWVNLAALALGARPKTPFR